MGESRKSLEERGGRKTASDTSEADFDCRVPMSSLKLKYLNAQIGTRLMRDNEKNSVESKLDFIKTMVCAPIVGLKRDENFLAKGPDGDSVTTNLNLTEPIIFNTAAFEGALDNFSRGEYKRFALKAMTAATREKKDISKGEGGFFMVTLPLLLESGAEMFTSVRVGISGAKTVKLAAAILKIKKLKDIAPSSAIAEQKNKALNVLAEALKVVWEGLCNERLSLQSSVNQSRLSEC